MYSLVWNRSAIDISSTVHPRRSSYAPSCFTVSTVHTTPPRGHVWQRSAPDVDRLSVTTGYSLEIAIVQWVGHRLEPRMLAPSGSIDDNPARVEERVETGPERHRHELHRATHSTSSAVTELPRGVDSMNTLGDPTDPQNTPPPTASAAPCRPHLPAQLASCRHHTRARLARRTHHLNRLAQLAPQHVAVREHQRRYA